jgi:hypothetical protein
MAINTDLEQLGGPQTRPNAPSEGVLSPGHAPSGVPVAPGAPQPAAPPSNVPAGVHPYDPSGPAESPIPGERATPEHPRGNPPFHVENGAAFPVNQRAASNWAANTFNVNSGQSPLMVARLRGCVSTKIWVPTGATAGVQISPNAGDISQGAGVVLNPGDSIELFTEDGIWLGVIPGQANGTCNVVRVYNKVAGRLGLTAG